MKDDNYYFFVVGQLMFDIMVLVALILMSSGT